MRLGGRDDFLCPFIWSHCNFAMDFFADLVKSVTETLTMIRQGFREESMVHIGVFERLVQFRAG
jgi:hypothetical protein